MCAAIRDGDFMTIQEKMNGILEIRDIVRGNLQRHPRGVFPRMQNQPYGAAFVVVDPGLHFIAQMGPGNDYQDTGNNEGEATYICTIERDADVIFEATLMQPDQRVVPLPIGTPKVSFVNHHNFFFNGELYRS